MNPTVSETRIRGAVAGDSARTVVPSVTNSSSFTATSLPVSARSSEDLPALVYPTSATRGRPARRSPLPLLQAALALQLAGGAGDLRAQLLLAQLHVGVAALAPPATATLAPQPGLVLANARQLVAQAGQIDLQLRCLRAGAQGEHPQDDIGAIHHLHFELGFQPVQLARTYGAVQDHQRSALPRTGADSRAGGP